MNPRPARRVVDAAAGLEKVARERRCRVCGSPAETRYQYGLSRHHLIPRSQGGDDVDVNIIPLCGSGTVGCHGRVEMRDPDALRRVRETMRMDEEAYCLRKVGADRLDRRYPPLRPEG